MIRLPISPCPPSSESEKPAQDGSLACAATLRSEFRSSSSSDIKLLLEASGSGGGKDSKARRATLERVCLGKSTKPSSSAECPASVRCQYTRSFTPALIEVMADVPSHPSSEGISSAVFANGSQLNDWVLLPSKVLSSVVRGSSRVGLVEASVIRWGMEIFRGDTVPNCLIWIHKCFAKTLMYTYG